MNDTEEARAPRRRSLNESETAEASLTRSAGESPGPRNKVSPGPSSPDLVENAWDDFARHLRRKGRRPATAAIYEKSWRAYWTWAADQGHPRDPSTVTRQHVDAWVDSMLDGHLERSTIRIRWQNLRPFFTWWAAETDATSPFAKAIAPEVEEKAVPVLDVEDIRQLLATCAGKDFLGRRDTALIFVLFATGARLGELEAMTVDGWNRKMDAVLLTGKTGTRLAQLDPDTGEHLARYVRARTQHPDNSLPWLWIGSKGRLRASGIAQVLARRSNAAGLERINPHAFRHTWAHLFRCQGGSEGDLMNLAGWKSPAMAHRYGRSAAGERARATARTLALGSLLGDEKGRRR